MRCLLLAGEIGSGKTTIANLLGEDFGARVVRVRQALANVLAVSPIDREALQREGRALDRRTNGAWLSEYLETVTDDASSGEFIVVDALRTERQTLPVLRRVEGAALAYLHASEAVRRRRFALAAADDPVKRSMPFDRAAQHPTELEVVHLRTHAQLVVETDEMTPADVLGALRPLFPVEGS